MPKEGALAWLDTWAMTKGAKNPELAEKWVDFVLQKKICGALTERNGFGNTVTPLASAGGDDKLVWLLPVEDFQKRNDLWNEVKARRRNSPRTSAAPILELVGIEKRYGDDPGARAHRPRRARRRVPHRPRALGSGKTTDPAADRRLHRAVRAARSARGPRHRRRRRSTAARSTPCSRTMRCSRT